MINMDIQSPKLDSLLSPGSSYEVNDSSDCVQCEDVTISAKGGDSGMYYYKDHAFFYGPKFVLKLAGIDRFGVLKPAYVIAVVLWLMWFTQVVYSMKDIFGDHYYYFIYQRIANLMWCFHNTVVYTVVTATVFHGAGNGVTYCHKYFCVMESLLEAGVVNRDVVCVNHKSQNEIDASVKAEEKKLVRVAAVLSVVSIIIVIVNTYLVGVQFFYDDEWDAYFPVSHATAWSVPVTIIWYFYAYGWSLSIVFVCLPTYVYTLRTEEYASYIEEHDDIDIEQAMIWYDDLYHYNRILNEIASPLVTLNVAICFPLTVFLILSYTNNEVSNVNSAVWILTNMLLMLLSAGSVANLYAVNYRISMAFGEKSSIKQFKDDQIGGYQLAFLKIKAIPFGVRFYGTRLFVTPQNVFQATALVSSFFVFLNAQSLSR